jgi:hypothetical protein
MMNREAPVLVADFFSAFGIETGLMASGFPLVGVVPVHFIFAPLFTFYLSCTAWVARFVEKSFESVGMEWKPRVVGRM